MAVETEIENKKKSKSVGKWDFYQRDLGPNPGRALCKTGQQSYFTSLILCPHLWSGDVNTLLGGLQDERNPN